MNFAAALRGLWTWLSGNNAKRISFIMGHDDEPEHVYERNPLTGQMEKVNDPATIEWRKKRAEQIKLLRREQQQKGKPPPKVNEPLKNIEAAPDPIIAVLVAPGKRIPWEIIHIPDGYSLADLYPPPIGLEPQRNDVWRVKFINSFIRSYGRMVDKVVIYDEKVERHRRERAFERAVAQEARERKAREKGESGAKT